MRSSIVLDDLAASIRSQNSAAGKGLPRAFITAGRFLDAGKRRLAGDTARAATSGEVKDLRRQAPELKEVVAKRALQLRLAQKIMIAAAPSGLSRGRRRALRKPDDRHPVLRHRTIDGALGAQLLAAVKSYLETSLMMVVSKDEDLFVVWNMASGQLIRLREIPLGTARLVGPLLLYPLAPLDDQLSVFRLKVDIGERSE